MSFPWYQAISQPEPLQQGDIINDCQVIHPPRKLEAGQLENITVKEIDAIVLTQSCDLGQNKVEIVLVCPLYPLKDFLDALPADQYASIKSKRKVVENLKKGYINGYHLLNKQADIVGDFMVADFKNVYGVHYDFLVELTTNTTNRVRLLPPYREHLSQAFARYFMRVGLPMDVDVEGYI
ncbi:MAG: hypothetical protein IPN76_29310 [Saprospiraceae bacterium]|nr:hypothetical protein [Saprospiraceae bacterium]